ncbi:hypothetical protein IAD21_06398 (plasmid) [Abditibacteriota bacterium]|nr:hypothetical protein IAD21_06398 [Abditibacteriota bacterium]
MNTPPLQLEQWLSFVIALPSHRSSNEGHRKFGERLVKLVYDELPAQHTADPVAAAYFVHMLAEVSWAVRGFSNVRDHFQAQATAKTAQFTYQGERAREWGAFSPLAGKSLGKQLVPLFFGAGGANLLSLVFPALPHTWNLGAAVALALVVHTSVMWLQDRGVKSALENSPKAVIGSWTQDARPQYRAIATTFLEKAYKIEQKFYPSPSGTTPPDFAMMVEKCFAFGT